VRRDLKAGSFAVGGILLALSVITLYMQALFPIADFTLYMISSFYISAIIIESGTSAGWIFYVASAVLAFIFVPNKIFLIPYILFFGYYGLIKYYIERLNRRPLEIVLKLLCFNAALFISIGLFRELLLGGLDLPDFPGAVIILVLEAAFIAYDYFYTLVIDFYRKRIRRR